MILDSLAKLTASTLLRAAVTHAPWTLAVRLVLSPALIGAASSITRRWGPEAGGWFAALPLTSGPVVLVLALERGPLFAAQACVGIVLAIVGLATYAFVYCHASRRLGWAGSGALACIAFLGSLWPLGRTRVSLAFAFLLACAAVLGIRPLLPRRAELRPPARPPVWDIPLRMVIAAAVVWGLAQMSAVVGPFVSGLLAPFPVAMTIMATFTHRHDGASAAQQFIRSLLVGLLSFAVFFLAVGALLPTHGIATAFAAGTLGALGTHAVVWRAIEHARVAPSILLEPR